ncbi:M23 family metallopeptidase [Actinopolymorpha sp. B17G11]|uniref:M23 family metallopeptidase n=1 Tax=Actinopolymorpha sp. B17G11 TaxID=3160861 RepID=UPI0032E46DB4
MADRRLRLASPPAATPVGHLDTPTIRQSSPSPRHEPSAARHEPSAARKDSPGARHDSSASASQHDGRRDGRDTATTRQDALTEGRLRPVGPRVTLRTTSSNPPRTGSALAGRRKKPGTRRRTATARAFPTIPAVASVATLVAAASGAVTLHSVAAAGIDDNAQKPPTGVALSLGQLQDARSAAAGRADRSRGGAASVDPGIDDSDAQRAAELRQETERERAAWEAQRTRELELIVDKASDATREQVFERAIQWFLPLRSFRTSAGFGQSGGMWSSDHTGQDFSAPMGTPIRAVGAGEITFAGWDGPYGNKIVVRHDDGTETWYCHMSDYEYTSGYVSAGTVIGYVGSTGNSTGPHLHFEVRPGGGDPIDPLPWLRGLGLPI